MERSTQSAGASSVLLYVVAAIIIGFILAFLIIRPGHALS
jgi:hypothetical protein